VKINLDCINLITIFVEKVQGLLEFKINEQEL